MDTEERWEKIKQLVVDALEDEKLRHTLLDEGRQAEALRERGFTDEDFGYLEQDFETLFPKGPSPAIIWIF